MTVEVPLPQRATTIGIDAGALELTMSTPPLRGAGGEPMSEAEDEMVV